jgi:hypothetical protein
MTLFDLANADALAATVPPPPERTATVFYWRNDAGLWRRHDPDSAPVWYVHTVAEALGRMAQGQQGLVRVEDAAAVDAWLAVQGATVQAVTA